MKWYNSVIDMLTTMWHTVVLLQGWDFYRSFWSENIAFLKIVLEFYFHHQIDRWLRQIKEENSDPIETNRWALIQGY
jgi:hypothetical protein